MWMFPKIGVYTPKWMVYNGKPYEQMDDLGVNTPIFGNTHVSEGAFFFLQDSGPQLLRETLWR